jgi:hypothetical protein
MRTRECGVWIVLLVALVAGCGDSVTEIVAPQDLAPPLGLASVTGDGAVTLSWQASNYDEDRQGFFVYRADGAQSLISPETIPAAFGTAPVDTLVNNNPAGVFSTSVGGLTNGTTYSFLVVAYKDNGDKASRPSNIVVDTPRVESLTLDLVNGVGGLRYLDVNTQTVQTQEDTPQSADVLCQSFDPGAGSRHGIVGVNGARIQDLGFVQSWDEIDEAPLGLGSYPAAEFSVQALTGHVYAVFTGDNHYAKLYVVSVHSGDFGYQLRVAYQPQIGSNELKPQ